MTIGVDVIMPVYNEERLLDLIDEIQSTPLTKYKLYLTIVDDGSSQPIADKVKQCDHLQIVRHSVNMGNGAAIKTGLFATQRELVVLMDGDGQHNPMYLEGLVDQLEKYDLVIANREKWANCGFFRAWANRFYCVLAGWLVDREIKDITSGFRAFKRSSFYRVFGVFPNKFSCPITLALFACLLNRTIGYYPITVRRRSGKSKIRIVRDGISFTHGIIKIGMLGNPMKFFYTLAAMLATTGVVYVCFNTLFIGRLFLPSGASVLFILGGISLVIAHIVDFARMILVLTIHEEGEFGGNKMR